MADTWTRKTIVVGSGASGGVVAARLSEDPAEQVVLIEAGPDLASIDDVPASLRDPENPSLEGHDWGYEAYWIEPSGDRQIGLYPRGRVLGGSSSVNAAIALRGIPDDFDGWAKLGNPGWDWPSVLPFFVALERDEDFGDQDFHGSAGPVPIRRGTFADLPVAVQALAAGFQERGFPRCEDLNAPDGAGFGLTPRNKVGDVKASTAVAYLFAARDRPNLEIRADSLVARVLVEDGRAVGVEVRRGDVTEVVTGDRVVLSGGGINTPQILMLSGIGPREVLERAGVPVVLDRPGVGRNLQDHPFVPLVFAAAVEGEARYGFRTQLRYSSGVTDTAPNDVIISSGLIRTSSMNFDVADGVNGAVMINPILGKPKASGWLEIVSSDPAARPEIHMNFLGDERDVHRLADAVRTILATVESETISAHVGELLVGPDPRTRDDDQALHRWMRDNVSTAFHTAGTCRMGPAGDDLAVVDEHLRVRGVDGLFVADASVMPDVTSGYTNLTCYMIGERLADWLLEKRDDHAAG